MGEGFEAMGLDDGSKSVERLLVDKQR